MVADMIVNGGEVKSEKSIGRTAAREKYNWRAVQRGLEAKGIRVLSAGSDEVPYAYQNFGCDATTRGS